MKISMSIIYFVLIVCALVIEVVKSSSSSSSNKETKNKPSKQLGKKKDLVDYSDADIERLYDEWEENDEEKLPDDELPEYKRPPPKIDMNELKGKPVDEIKKMSKKDRALMIFVTVSGNPTRDEGERITQLWQTSLFNANYESTRYMIEDNKAIFMIKDGSRAWEIKDFLVTQERCLEVNVDDEIYPGNHFKDSFSSSNKKKKTNMANKEL